jgi:hypothetical protein
MQMDMQHDVQVHNMMQTNQRIVFVLYVIQYKHRILFEYLIFVGGNV